MTLQHAGRLVETRKLDAAEGLTDGLLKASPADWHVAMAVFQFWLDHGNPDEAADVGLAILNSRASMTHPRPMTNTEAGALAVEVSDALDSAGDHGQSEQVVREALRLDPTNAIAANDVAYLLAQRGKSLDWALRLARQAVHAEPDDASFVDTLGWVHFKRGNPAEAERYLRRAVAVVPDSADLREHLAEAQWRLGDTPGAYVEAQKALLLNPGFRAARKLRTQIMKRYHPRGPF